MSDLLLRQVKVIDPGGPHHDAETDILISGGRIARIAVILVAPFRLAAASSSIVGSYVQSSAWICFSAAACPIR